MEGVARAVEAGAGEEEARGAAEALEAAGEEAMGEAVWDTLPLLLRASARSAPAAGVWRRLAAAVARAAAPRELVFVLAEGAGEYLEEGAAARSDAHDALLVELYAGMLRAPGRRGRAAVLRDATPLVVALLDGASAGVRGGAADAMMAPLAEEEAGAPSERRPLVQALLLHALLLEVEDGADEAAGRLAGLLDALGPVRRTEDEEWPTAGAAAYLSTRAADLGALLDWRRDLAPLVVAALSRGTAPATAAGLALADAGYRAAAAEEGAAASVGAAALDDGPWAAFQAVSTVMVQWPEAGARAAAHETLKRMLSLLDDEARFRVLENASLHCPLQPVASLMLQAVRAEVHAALGDARAPSRFASPAVADLARAALAPGDAPVRERADALSSAANLYRFLLLRDAGPRQTGVHEAHADFAAASLGPLRERVRRAAEECEEEGEGGGGAGGESLRLRVLGGVLDRVLEIGSAPRDLGCTVADK